MSLLADLKASPSQLTKSSKFTLANGVIYMGAGAWLMIWPGSVQALFLDPEFMGREAALIRVLGMAVVIIGWLYFSGGTCWRAACPARGSPCSNWKGER